MMSHNIICPIPERTLDILKKKGRKSWESEKTQIIRLELLKIRDMDQAGVHNFSQI